MSLLRIFRPEEDAADSSVNASFSSKSETTSSDLQSSDDEAIVLNFEEHSAALRVQAGPQLLRARRIHAQCQCPECRSALVVPLVLNDGRRDRSGKEIPGTSTLVGFRCDVCSTEWPA